MSEERLHEILGKLEQCPDKPLMMLIDQEAMDAIDRIRMIYPEAHLVMMSGIRYITITDKALEQVLERLEMERDQYAQAVARYDRDIKGVKDLIGSGKRHYWSQACMIREPASLEEKRKWNCVN